MSEQPVAARSSETAGADQQPQPGVAQHAHRKDEHVALAVSLHDPERRTGYDDVAFMHHALPGTSIDAVDTRTEVLGTTWGLPLYINAMTGGTPKTAAINADLARAAAGAGIAIATGSQHVALRDPELAETFSVIRRNAPDAFVLANVGPTVSPELARRAVEMLDANALQIHLNVAQEVVMPEGDRDFSSWSDAVAAIVEAVDVPVVVKEVGFGLSRRTVDEVIGLGVSAVDVAGNGGTDFVAIENSRRPGMEYSYLTGWGQSAVLCLLESAAGPDAVDVPVLASGGVRTPLDVVRALSLGARAAGASGHFLRTLVGGGPEALEAELDSWTSQLRSLMALVGASDVPGLQRTDVLVTGQTAERARLLGIDLERLALRSRG
ncbi:type 2 isopentenyl-diphosphate Delta-isomerase [Actinomyces radicidentis]|uniref:type 2 isopentenyl-diphosphate Delta-isomerase n=1 Tax=Actinomyces radicidentis TaxID=111015 RepID=UPI0026E088FD|nr:type 2 isopentenyl-diphosphate Delta-isomerase [Actinomyces radicidentis]